MSLTIGFDAWFARGQELLGYGRRTEGSVGTVWTFTQVIQKSKLRVKADGRKADCHQGSTPSRFITHIGIMIVIFEGMLARLQ
jgi:hypothetical protein